MTQKQKVENKIYSMQRFIFGLLDKDPNGELVKTSKLQLIGMMRMAIEIDLFTPFEMDVVLSQIKHAEICG